MKLGWSPLTSIWLVVFLFFSFQKSSLMFKRLDASTLPEDILSNTETLPMMAHSAGSALWVCACVHICNICTCVSIYVFVYCFSLSQYRTRGGFVALSPISPQELFLQPISSDTEASQQKDLVRKRTNMSLQPLIPQPCLKAVVLNIFKLVTTLKQSIVGLSQVTYVYGLWTVKWNSNCPSQIVSWIIFRGQL